jgi:hypothetical protein
MRLVRGFGLLAALFITAIAVPSRADYGSDTLSPGLRMLRPLLGSWTGGPRCTKYGHGLSDGTVVEIIETCWVEAYGSTVRSTSAISIREGGGYKMVETSGSGASAEVVTFHGRWEGASLVFDIDDGQNLHGSSVVRMVYEKIRANSFVESAFERTRGRLRRYGSALTYLRRREE